ncbi:hypothetical protein PPHE_a1992 [Pseudoalteromonas phenolica O-BC30]|nr:hypothetical protein [Pseudoalteromonas phenolica O-BC30]
MIVSKLKSRIDVDPNLNDQLKLLTKILTNYFNYFNYLIF